MNRTKMFLSSLLVVMLLVGLTLSVSSEVQKGKVVIAHRGASGYLPETPWRLIQWHMPSEQIMSNPTWP